MNKGNIWFPAHLWIDGRWQDRGSAGKTFSVTNPATGEELTSVPSAGKEEAESAVEAAGKALRSWRKVSPVERGQYLGRLASLLMEHKENLAKLLTLEMGKPLIQARSEVDYAAGFYRWYGGEAGRIYERSVPHPQPEKRSMVKYYPAGVVGAITPWNLPLAQGAKKIAAALAAGCTVVLKPSRETPLTSLAFAWLTGEAKLPPGVFNVIVGDSSDIGEVLVKHPAVRVISLTGSTETGQYLMSQAGQYIKKVSLELGGNAPFIVLDDADSDLAVDDLLRLKFMGSGQVCVTANRVFVQKKMEAEFMDKLLRKISGIKVGYGLEPDTDVGPLINARACAKVESLVQDALRRGAVCSYVWDMSRLAPDLVKENFYPPTVLTKVPDTARIFQEEIFGPVIPVYSFESEEEVIARANNTVYGLAAYIYTGNFSRAERLVDEIEVGIIGVNDLRPLRPEVPFGGVKMSGLGYEGGIEGMHEFLSIRTVGIKK